MIEVRNIIACPFAYLFSNKIKIVLHFSVLLGQMMCLYLHMEMF